MLSMIYTNSILLLLVTPLINVSLATPGDDVEPSQENLVEDDECIGQDGDAGCAVNALQRTAAQRIVDELDAESMEEADEVLDAEDAEDAQAAEAEAEGVNTTGCYHTGSYMTPNFHSRKHEPDLFACQDRCVQTPGCAYFSFWPDHGCQIQAGNAHARRASHRYGGVMSATRDCQISHRRRYERRRRRESQSAGHHDDNKDTTTTTQQNQHQDTSGMNTMTVYHQTSPEACNSILKTGFRLGHGGYCGGAIYFALSPEATKTKAITPHSGSGCMLQAVVNVGRVKKYPCCKYCGGKKNQHMHWTESSLKSTGYDSIQIDPGDGTEVIIFNNKQIVSLKTIPFQQKWTPRRLSGNW